MYFRPPKGPWYRWSADLVGSLPRSQRGHQFLLVIQDQFIKWVELVPIENTTGKNVSDKLKDVLMRYGTRETLLMDNGTQCVSIFLKHVADNWDFAFQNTAPYSPQSNPVERSNRVVKTIIAQFVKENHEAWDVKIGGIRFARNSAVHESTGYSPAMFLLGRELKPPGAFIRPSLETSSNPEAQTLTRIYGARVGAFKRLYENAHRNLKTAYQRQAKYYNLRRRDVNHEVGERVIK